MAIVLMALGVVSFMALAFFGGGAIVYAAWNWGVATVVDVPPLGFYPACFIAWALSLLRGTRSS